MFRDKCKLILSISIIILLLFSSVHAVPYIKLVINGQQVYPDVPPQIINGTTLVPIRVISETLGAKVNWDGDTQTVAVDMPQYTLEAQTVEYYWELAHENIDNIVPPSLDTTVSNTLKSYLSDAYALLKQKAPNTYRLVCAYIPKIGEATLNNSNIFAITHSDTHYVVFNTTSIKALGSNTRFYSVECIAVTLAHEAYHEQQLLAGAYDIDAKSVEALAYTYEYAVAKQLGAEKILTDWIKTQIINNLN